MWCVRGAWCNDPNDPNDTNGDPMITNRGINGDSLTRSRRVKEHNVRLTS